MEFLVQVPAPDDVGAFRDAMSVGGLSVASHDTEWVESVLPDAPRPQDAQYFCVTAGSRDSISQAVIDAQRMTQSPKLWVNGPPQFNVLAERESRTYPATDFS